MKDKYTKKNLPLVDLGLPLGNLMSRGSSKSAVLIMRTYYYKCGERFSIKLIAFSLSW